jgi:hypothetical protein
LLWRPPAPDLLLANVALVHATFRQTILSCELNDLLNQGVSSPVRLHPPAPSSELDADPFRFTELTLKLLKGVMERNTTFLYLQPSATNLCCQLLREAGGERRRNLLGEGLKLQ